MLTRYGATTFQTTIITLAMMMFGLMVLYSADLNSILETQKTASSATRVHNHEVSSHEDRLTDLETKVYTTLQQLDGIVKRQEAADVAADYTTIVAVGPCHYPTFNVTLDTADQSSSSDVWTMQRASDMCPEHFCDHVGYYITLNKSLPQLPASLSSIRTIYEGQSTKHALTACISPLTLFVDWTNLIDFIEVWSQQGMELLHAYWHSMSSEAEQILDLYVKAGLAVKHEWPSLPNNISEHLILYGQLVSYHDCLMLSRHDAHWTAFMDLDELMYVQSGTLVDYLNSYAPVGSVPIGIMSFISYFSYPSWDRTETELNPRNYDIDYLKSFEMETVVRMMPKSIYRPEGGYRMNVHYPVELMPGYIKGTADSSIAFMAHVRKPDRHDKRVTHKFTGLSSVVTKAQASWHIRRSQLPDTIWPWHAIAVTQVIDECNLGMFNDPGCWAFERCNFLLNMTEFGMKFAEPSDIWSALTVRQTF